MTTRGPEMSEDGKLSREEKSRLIETSFAVDQMYLAALDKLRQGFQEKGIDIESGEGRKQFVRAVRDLNSRFV